MLPTPIILDLAPLIDLADDMAVLRLSQANPNLRLEVNKEQKLIVNMPTFFKTGTQNAKLTFYVQWWNEKHQLGEVCDSSAGFRMPVTKSLLSPDVSFISFERLKTLVNEDGFLKIAPDFVIELKSSSDSLKELMEKMEEYLENGTDEGWLIDPDKQKAFIYRLLQAKVEQDFDQEIQGSGIMQQLKINLRSIFPKK
jgi:Uma2 family endonuclease